MGKNNGAAVNRKLYPVLDSMTREVGFVQMLTNLCEGGEESQYPGMSSNFGATYDLRQGKEKHKFGLSRLGGGNLDMDR